MKVNLDILKLAKDYRMENLYIRWQK